LKFEQPRVYVSDYLPQMRQPSEATTRPLDQFEQQGLASLQTGDDLFTVVDDGEIRMLGSLRAIKICLGCHAVQRGDVLGAFSYRISRSPQRQRAIVRNPPHT
jgi:hypothetical protein